MQHLILLVVSLVPFSLGQSSFLNYLLLVPAEVHYPSTETVYVHVSGAREKLTVTITLQCSGQDHILLQEEVTPPGLSKSIKFQTLPPEGGAEEVVFVHISLIGPNTQISESKNILVRGVGSATLIQTDKPIYKQGETVRFRIVSFDRDFLAINDICPLVELQDPNKNRIGQWLNLTPQKGIIDLSHSLDSEAQLGAYTIISPKARQFFHVSEYVVPNFEVVIKLPSVVSVLDESIVIKTCGRYTFGKPIQGEINGKLCRKASCYYWHYWHGNVCPSDVCMEYRGRTDRNGCFEVEIETEPFHLRSYDYQLNFDAEAFLVEDGTGVQMNVTSSCRISAMIARVTFEDLEVSDSFYKPGLKYKTKLKLVGADGSPMKSQTLYVTEKYDNVTKDHVYETDENGEACITLDTNPWNRHTVLLSATYKKNRPEREFQVLNPYFVDAYQNLQPFSSITNTFLKIQPLAEVLSCDRVHQIEIDYIIRGSEVITDEDHLDLHYVVVAKGDLVLNGQMKVSINRNSVTMGSVELPLMVTADIAPTVNILVYALLGNNGRIAADTEQFQVTKCFNNKVTLNFSKPEASPGSQVTLQVNAHPGSLCSVRAVDEGVLLMRPEAEISNEAAYRFLLQRNQYGYPYRVREDDAPCWNPVIVPFNAYKRRKRSLDWSTPTAPDVFTLIKKLGLKIITNTQIKKPRECPWYPPVMALSSYGAYPIDSHVSSVQSITEVDKLEDEELRLTFSVHELKKIRKIFPETWIWNLVTVGTSGQTDIQVHLPDTITEWKTMAFCMGDVGLGIAPTTSMKAFQPLFSDLNLPYSAVRGEAFTFTATVFNYMPKPLMVKINIEDCPELEIKDCPTCSSLQCVFPEQTKVFTWEAKALRTGSANIVMNTEAISTAELCNGQQPVVPEDGATDSLMKTVLIKAEGMPVETFYNSILCGEGTVACYLPMTEAPSFLHHTAVEMFSTLDSKVQGSLDSVSSENFSIALPPVVVPNSASAVFTVMGDIMGSALQGIEKLLDRPVGCGEQTMVRFVPNIYLMDYLESTNQRTKEIQQLGQEYIMHGYQRQLNYQRKDGSFSAFGERDEEGNTWLSAFVMKSFSAASRYIPVDKKCIRKIVNWLKENQLPSGSFKNRGKLFKASLKGGVADEVTLNAYVTLSLLETGQLLKNEMMENEMLQNALQWLRSIVFQIDSLYTKAMLAYMFTLSKDYEIRETLLKELHNKAVKTAGETYWPANPNNPSKESSWSQPNSNEVETASYMVLAHLSDVPTTQDIKEASSISRRLSRQQNPYGGFDNTQETVLGLQSLSRFSKITYTRHGGLDVVLSQDEENVLDHFQVEEANRLLLQKTQLKQLPGNYNVQVNGVGCAFVQITLRYNMYTAKVSSFFDLHINITAEDSKDQSKYRLHYTISARYMGPRKVTNMVLLESELPSGFSANSESLTKLKTHTLVRRIETPDNKVVVYITELCKEFQNFTFSVQQDFMVQNQKSQFIKVYDYYQTGEEASMIYYLPNQLQ